MSRRRWSSGIEEIGSVRSVTLSGVGGRITDGECVVCEGGWREREEGLGAGEQARAGDEKQQGEQVSHVSSIK